MYYQIGEEKYMAMALELAHEAAAAGDETAAELLDCYTTYLSEGITNIINIFQPEVIALGGGVSHEKEESLLFPLRERLSTMCFGREAQRHTTLVKAKLGNDAGIIGAALLGLQQ